MKISKDLMQFNGGASLLLVAGREDAKFYIAQNGNISRVDAFRVKKLEYSDREGYSEKRMSGEAGQRHHKISVAGSEYEMKNPMLIHDFLMLVLSEFNKVARRYEIERIYFFCAPYMKKRIKKVFPTVYQRKIIMTIDGDYHAIHPFKLIEIIQGSLESKKIKIIKPEAKRILDSGKF